MTDPSPWSVAGGLLVMSVLVLLVRVVIVVGASLWSRIGCRVEPPSRLDRADGIGDRS